MDSIPAYLSNLFGVEVNAVILLLAIVSAYPFNLFFVVFFRKSCERAKCVYFLFAGLLVIWLAFGIHIVHSLLNCFICYFTLKYFSPRCALVLNFAFTMMYLLYGYYQTQIDWHYTITWTMPQCILTLRLIAFSFDIYDGKNKKEKDFGNTKHTESALTAQPPLLYFLSYCYFPGTLIAGPLIPYVSFLKFIQNKDYNRKAIYLSFLRLLSAFLITGVFVVGSFYWPIEYLQSEDFQNSSLFWKLTSMAIVSKIYLHKYILCWLFSEASCILSGITYNGVHFYQFSNINLLVFESASSFTTIIKSFNITTNNFSFKYIYRRLKFLGNVYLSQIITLTFLSIWHGFDSGYHLAFSIEFLLLYFEKNLATYYKSIKEKHILNSKYIDIFVYILGKVYTFYFIGYSFVPFIFLHSNIWYPILSSVYFIGHTFLISYILLNFLLGLVN